MYAVCDREVRRVWYKCKYPEGAIAHDSPAAELQTRILHLAQKVCGLDERLAEPGVQLLFLLDCHQTLRFVGTQTSTPLHLKTVSGMGLHADSSSQRSLSGSVLRQKTLLRPNSTLHVRKTVLSSRLLVMPQKPTIRVLPTAAVMVDQEAQATDFSEILNTPHRTIKVSKQRVLPAVGWAGSLLARPLLPGRFSLEGRRSRASPPLRASFSSVRTGRHRY